ncbi:MAG: GTP-binding protein [Aquamicrobium sp.]|uniref:CobW family GTP-binding protein n=1 Tax=Aquamicrobium sp. TaxID=1872579 RepID=UPI00349F03B7|nr:GTP-binding protein [Aquamicrobium sp.]
MEIDWPVAVSIVTGFLGAGKTTLLNRLLKDPALANTAVIINEFGEVSIDHLLVEKASDGVIELSDGCLCCTVRGELVDTLADLIERMQTGRIAPLERIVIETTGLADPVPVLQSVMAHPVLMQALRLDGVVCVVDAVNGAATLDAHEEAVRQVAVADRLVLTKTGLAAPGELPGLRERLRRLNPAAPIIDAEDRAPAATLVNCGLYDPETKTADVRRWLGETEYAHHHHIHGDHDHDDHHHHHHDDRIATVSLTHDRPMPFAAVEAFLDLLRATQGEKLLRMKGIIELAEDPERPLVIHGVQKLLHSPVQLPAWPAGARGTRIVLITCDMPDDYAARLFAAFMDEPAPDTPDRAALQDNPLAIAGFKG